MPAAGFLPACLVAGNRAQAFPGGTCSTPSETGLEGAWRVKSRCQKLACSLPLKSCLGNMTQDDEKKQIPRLAQLLLLRTTRLGNIYYKQDITGLFLKMNPQNQISLSSTSLSCLAVASTTLAWKVNSVLLTLKTFGPQLLPVPPFWHADCQTLLVASESLLSVFSVTCKLRLSPPITAHVMLGVCHWCSE